jgi:uncharacterized protein YfaS (alpha-2-macroglobulin family)
VESPDGNSESDNVDLEDDEFFFEFELDNGAADGIYVVEVEYAGESRFSYFLVNEDNDAIEVVTDSDEYDPGDSVEVSGSVLDPVTGEDEVEIDVRDPNGDLIVDGVNVDLDSSDEFEYEFDLDDDAPVGRYAISVEYDGESMGFWLFEVE